MKKLIAVVGTIIVLVSAGCRIANVSVAEAASNTVSNAKAAIQNITSKSTGQSAKTPNGTVKYYFPRAGQAPGTSWHLGALLIQLRPILILQFTALPILILQTRL